MNQAPDCRFQAGKPDSEHRIPEEQQMDHRRSRRYLSRSMRGARFGLLVGLLVGLAFAVPSLGSPAAAATGSESTQTSSPKKTVVSLTFDDGLASQHSTLPVLRSHGMTATFYVNSAMVGSSSHYMPWAQILQLANAGNEIGSHTLHHIVLSQVSEQIAVDEICGDRKNLIQQGLAPVTSFAYPSAVQRQPPRAVRSCGFSSARSVGGGGALLGEDIPPADPFKIRTSEAAGIGMTVQDFERNVTNAERQNGTRWIILVFHDICVSACAAQASTQLPVFARLLDWLEVQRSEGKIIVRTVGDVIANGLQASTSSPHTTVACIPSPCSDSTSRPKGVRVSMHVAGAKGSAATYYTTDGTNPKTSASWQRYTHPFAVSGTTTVRFYSRDAAGHSEPVQSQRIQGPVPGMAGVGGPGQTLGVTSSRRFIAGTSFVLFMVTLIGGIGLLWRSTSRRRLQPNDEGESDAG